MLLIRVKPLWLIVALLAQIGTYLFSSVIIQKLLRAFDIRPLIKVRELFQASIVMLFINQTIPTAGISGNMFFFNFLKKRGISQDVALPIILTELLTFYAAIISIIILLLFVCFFVKKIPSVFIPILFAGLAVYLVLAILIGLFGKGKTVRFLFKTMARIPFLRKSIQPYEVLPFERLKSPWHIFSEHARVTIEVIFLQICIFFCDAITIAALFRGLNLPVSFLSVFIGFILTIIIALLPISPGALILYEGSMTFFYASLGVPVAIAAVVTLLYRVLSFWLPIPVGFFLYRKLQSPKETEAFDAEIVESSRATS